ncbi:hypothetical protein ACHAWU_006677 [Discostella pseudostelligera]|uniref:Uncharacterized protein n=1 Tax=Discostella pseudostelligera TaxID=259834 RepID=A0ABD3MA96_9STRA
MRTTGILKFQCSYWAWSKAAANYCTMGAHHPIQPRGNNQSTAASLASTLDENSHQIIDTWVRFSSSMTVGNYSYYFSSLGRNAPINAVFAVFEIELLHITTKE